MPVLEVSKLSTQIRLKDAVVQAVTGVSLDLEPGETLGLVGESGSGKSMTGLSIMGLLPAGGEIVEGSVRLDGKELVGLPAREMRQIRGNDIGMVFQDSSSSLDPTKTVGYQVAEQYAFHRGVSRRESLERAVELLGLVGIPQPRQRLGEYPHQFSGGQRQRVMIAMALSCEPRVLIADEPTTALDVTIQGEILALLDDLKQRLGMAVILITHDMGVVAGHTDRVSVMYAGRIVEEAETSRLFRGMRHPYTQGLLASIPRMEQSRTRLLFSIPGLPPELTDLQPGCAFAPRCWRADKTCRQEQPTLLSVDVSAPELTNGASGHRYACWHTVLGPRADDETESYEGPGESSGPTEGPDARQVTLSLDRLVRTYRVGRRSVKAVSGVSLQVRRGQTFGLVGESGCGKTTLGRMVVGLDVPDSGSVQLDGRALFHDRGQELRRSRRDVQMMFQDSFGALDPRLRVEAILREPLRVQGIGTRAEQDDRIGQLVEAVGLARGMLERYPHELSGGQRQRVGLARALILHPRVVVADEPVSALDVSIRSQVLNLMKRLQTDQDITYLVISHDLAVVKYLADQIGVMYLGKLVECGPSEVIYRKPVHPYTAALIDSIPIPDPTHQRQEPRTRIEGELPSPINPPSGCRFRTRCAFAQERCAEEEPILREFGSDHIAACHFPLFRPAGESRADRRPGEERSDIR